VTSAGKGASSSMGRGSRALRRVGLAMIVAAMASASSESPTFPARSGARCTRWRWRNALPCST
jgi:hypothetical protein